MESRVGFCYLAHKGFFCFLALFNVMSLTSSGDVQFTGSITQGSSRELKENITELSSFEALETLEGLNPIKFNYKANTRKQQQIGFIAEDVPELVATSDRKGLSSMDIVGVLTKVVQEQQKTILTLVDKGKALEAKNVGAKSLNLPSPIFPQTLDAPGSHKHI